MPNFRPNQNEYNNMTPFKTWLKYQINTWGLNSFPFVESDFDDLTNYAMMMKLMKHFNVLIENQNMVEEDMTALYNAFTELQTYLFDEFADYKNEVDGEIEQFENNVTTDINDFKTLINNQVQSLEDFMNNYFDNLDVQNEINNKLDDMVESGILQEIIADYLNSKALFVYDNVATMKQATNLINGSYAKTLGFYNINDGGHGLYKIRNITNNDDVNDGSIIAMNNPDLVAELIEDKKDIINVLQWGAFPDDSTDNTSILNKIIDYVNEKEKNIYIPNGIYQIDNDLHGIKSPISIFGDISGSGAFENKSIIKDNRISNNYLFNFTRENKTGGSLLYINFKNMNNLYKNKCINLNDSQC